MSKKHEAVKEVEAKLKAERRAGLLEDVEEYILSIKRNEYAIAHEKDALTRVLEEIDAL